MLEPAPVGIRTRVAAVERVSESRDHLRAPWEACQVRRVTWGAAAMEIMFERVAAIDVGKKEIAVAVRIPGEGPGAPRVQKVRKFTTFYPVLAQMVAWLVENGVRWPGLHRGNPGVSATRLLRRVREVLSGWGVCRVWVIWSRHVAVCDGSWRRVS